jgi:L-iditol 2-dehydrogenase
MSETPSNQAFPIPETMKAWVLDDPDQLRLVEKPVPEPWPAPNRPTMRRRAGR